MKAINYGLVAVTVDETDPSFGKIMHFCGYETKPTEEDKIDLEIELDINKKFGLVGRINKDVFVVMAPKEIVKNMAECIIVPKDPWDYWEL